jgi:hypothetical protein
VKPHRIHLFPRFCAIACLLAATLHAADQRGMVKFGGLPIPGVTVTATQDDKKVSAITEQDGTYSFANLANGIWKVHIEMLCFEPIDREVAVGPDAPPSAEWELKLQPFDQIKAQAPPPAPSTPAPAATTGATPQATAQTSSTPTKSAQAAPTKKGKNPPPQAANTSSGFQRAEVNASGDGAKATNDGARPTDNGPTELNQQPSDGLLINGSVNNGAASPFAQSAAFGNNRRLGRSLYNGSLGFILDNSVLDARTFSLTGQDTPKPSYSRITGLASFGGPLKIPHITHGNGPNVFLNYQWKRDNNSGSSSGLMPTLALRTGDFSQVALPIIDPTTITTTRTPFPGNVIPQNRISPQAKTLLSLYPLPNFSSTQYNYQIPLVNNTHQDSLQSRVQKTIGRKNQVTGIFAFQNTRSDSPNLFNFEDKTGSLGLNTNVTWMHRMTQRMFATTTVQYSRMSSRTRPFFANRENISGEAGITGNNQDPINWGPPSLSFSTGISGLSDANYSFMRFQTAAISESVFWSHGAHNITAGGDFRRQQFNLISQQNPRGGFSFTGAATRAVVTDPSTGYDFADFLLGIPDTSSIAFGNADKYFRAGMYDLYATDDWRVSPSLTINWGARWEYNAPITELYGRIVNLDIAPGYSAVAAVLGSNPVGALTGQHYPDSLVRPDKHAIQPRIGLSWRPFLASSMVIRAGYGVYYNTSFYMPIANFMAQQSPLSKSLSVQNTPDNPLTLADPFHAAPNITTNTYAVDPNFLVGYAQNWNASVQRDLPWSLVMIANYLGIKGTRAQQAFWPNTYPAGVANPCPTCPSGYRFLTSNGNSTRHQGQFQLRRRLHNGITAQAQYTFSKSIDDAAVGGGGPGANPNAAPNVVVAQNWLNLRGERGLSNFDQRHLANFTIQYTTGMGLGGGTLMGGWKGPLMKDWTFSTGINAGSGFPLTPIYPAVIPGTGQTGIRPDYKAGVSIYDAPAGLHLNPAAVAAPVGHWGNAGRNSITGPDTFSLNASMARTFRVSDRVSADLRIDANNALNHVTYPSWNTVVGGALFGLPVAANQMRTMQVTMRARF